MRVYSFLSVYVPFPTSIHFTVDANDFGSVERSCCSESKMNSIYTSLSQIIATYFPGKVQAIASLVLGLSEEKNDAESVREKAKLQSR